MADSLTYPVEVVEVMIMEEADDGLAPPPDPALSKDNHAAPAVSAWSIYGPNRGIGAFMSLNPPQPVLLFADAFHANQFQAKHAPTSTRFVPGRNTHWLYVNAPAGLDRVYSTKEHHEQGETVADGESMTGTDGGEFVFEFGKENDAKLFNREVGHVGTIQKKEERGGVWNVFVGKF